MKRTKANVFRTSPARLALAACLTALCALPAAPQDDLGRRALEHEDYEAWNSVGGESLSEDGRWVAFTTRPADEGAATLTIREVGSRKEYTIVNGSSARFSHDSRYVAYSIVPDPDLLKKLEKEDGKKGERPNPKLEILDLESGRHVTLHDVRSFRFPEEAGGWIAYSPSEPKEAQTLQSGESAVVESYAIEGAGLTKRSPGAAAAEPAAEPQAPAASKEQSEAPKKGKAKEKRKKDNGDVLVLRDLETGIERRFPDVTSHEFSKYGARLAFATSATDAEDDGVFVVDLATDALTQVLAGRGSYTALAFSEDEKRLAFLSDRDDYGPVKPSLSLYLWTADQDEAVKIADGETEALPDGWWLASDRPVFTEDGRRLLFETQPRPEDAGKTKEELEKEKKAKELEPEAVLDVWHWKDPALQPQQVLRANRERNRSYRALYDLKAKRVVQLAREDLQTVSIDPRARGDVAVGSDSQKYDVTNSWESPGFSDTYLVDLNTGAAELVLEEVRGNASLSPGGEYITWWDPDQERQFVMSTAEREAVDVSAGIPTSLANELHDTPAPPRSYGSAGWLEDDAALLLYDRFDLWRVDPTGVEPPECLTSGHGRASGVRYRHVDLDPEERAIGLGAPLLLSVFDEGTKASGFAELDPATGALRSLLMLDERLGRPRKARQGDTIVLTRESFRRYPDLWATTTAFEELTRLSQANPQQRDYLWGSAELVHYQTADEQPLDGLLYKPDNFDPSKKYPLLVYFYERSSDGLHRYHTPAAGSSSINFSFYASRGYVLFVPDIPYETGHPGASAANAILPGIQTVVDLGFVDPERIGVQGHSWGGYQIAYLVTRTNVFACAEAGAPVSNMTSAYGGIRWGSGMSRMFQYERTQSRIGDTLWNARELYIENSPVFFADKVETPLLILHNDEDGAVPWYQGIELFVALRRLGKPAWMLNYNGEDHGLRKKENKLDFAKRMQQFFDHHLQGAPATKWIAEGIPAVEKGKEFGFEPVEVAAEPAPAEEPEPEPAVPVAAEIAKE